MHRETFQFQKSLNKFTIRKLPFGFLCLEDDCNFPVRAEKMDNPDIDNQFVEIAKRAGVGNGDIVVDVGAFIGDTHTL